MSRRQLHLFVSGHVQGVAFRANSVRIASNFGLCGWVRNLPDGRVELLAQGDEKALRHLLSWAHQGPSQSRVDHLEAHWNELTESFQDFHIREA